ncbi:hypothetical protein BGZ97_010412 [Linnemannia gamsii]|uniref:F-box domain-containing protein n=1 Tax=Linnemannia gamsii TaxID=64522 RepID=A0A9P6UP50_9FUNG|nr:hypothetical protein BGZ97_010412 [Linnemannia gamsii]
MTCPTAPSPTLFTLPTEVYEIILLFLNQHDLSQCIRVSRAWNKTLIPHLWCTLSFRSRSQLKRFMTDKVQQTLAKNAKYVRELHLVHKLLYHQSLPSRQILISEPGIAHLDVFTIGPFTNLHALVLHHWRGSRYVIDERVLALVRQNPGLKRLVINVEMDPKVQMDLIIKYIPNLQDLDLTVSWRGDVKALLENLPECIRTVKMRDVHHLGPGTARKEASPSESGASLTTMKRHHALEFFQIGGNLAGKEAEILVPFLKSCSQSLHTFGGKESSCYNQNEKITSALSDFGLVWTDLTGTSADAKNARSISLNSNLTSINTFAPNIGPLTVAAIVNNCERLETLNIIGYTIRGLMGSHLQAILSTATRLRSLQAHWLLCGYKISAMDILSSDWATTSLEHVDLKIHIPRAADDDTATAIQSSRDTQRQVLRRFGRQTNLRILAIGGMAVNPTTGNFGVQLSCLDMTLESGLDELRDLQNLEFLDIHHMDHRVGVPELEWIAANLPQLSRLHGMLDSLTPPSPEVQEWLQTHRPTWT